MADWNQPTLSTNYATYHQIMLDRGVDSATLAETPTNPPTGFIRYNRTLNKFQEWSGAVWVDKVLAVEGGGTGGATQAAARTGLGLGTIAVQNNNAVAITGGTVSGLTSLDVSGNANISGRLDINSAAPNALEVTGGIRAGSGNVDIVDTTGRIPELSSTYFASLVAQGAWTFSTSITTALATISSAAAVQLIIRDTAAGLDEQYWRIIHTGGDLLFQPVNDAFGAAGTPAIALRRSGNACVQIEFSDNLFLPASKFVYFGSTSLGIGQLGLTNEVTISSPNWGGSNYGLSFFPFANGSGTPGTGITLGRNISGGAAPAFLSLMDKNGTAYYLWVDTTGKLRINTSIVNEGVSDTTGTVVGTQT